MKPLLSICIPTYNRSKFLAQLLKSIEYQIVTEKLDNLVEIIISDNNSTDTTPDIVTNYQKLNPNIHYFRNKCNIGGPKNMMKVATYASGNYVWFFSDDDLQKKDAIHTVITTIQKHQPDVLWCNLLHFESKTITSSDCFHMKQDRSLNDRKELFQFLSSKLVYIENDKRYLHQRVLYPIDWFTTYCSALIIKNSILTRNYQLLKKRKVLKRSVFPHAGLLYYLDTEFKSYIISKPIVLCRMNNLAWQDNNKIRFENRCDKIMTSHNKLIVEANKNNISLLLYLYFLVRHWIRRLRVYELKLGFR